MSPFGRLVVTGGATVVVLACMVTLLTGCMSTRVLEYQDGQLVRHTGETRFMYLDPDGTNLVAQDVSGLHINVAVPGTGLGLGFSAGGATSMSAPEGADLMVTNGATLDAEGNIVGWNRRVSTGQLTDEAPTSALDVIREALAN